MKRLLRLQLSLRMLLALMIGLGLWMGFVARRAHRQRAIVEWVEAQGGFVHYDRDVDWQGPDERDIRLLPPEASRPAGWIPLPASWKAWLGPHYEWSVVEVRILASTADDLSPLADLDELLRLTVHGSGARKLPRTTAWKKMFSLQLSGNALEDLEGLEELSSLKVLYVDQSPVRDLTPLARLTQLESLSLLGLPASDLPSLAGLTQLEFLSVRALPIHDLRPLAGLTSLEYLGVDSREITDLTPLAGLKRLKQLDLGPAQVSDLSPLKDLEQLEHLKLGNPSVSDLSPLKNLKLLKDLTLEGTGITSLEGLRELACFHTLEQLNVSHTAVHDVSPLDEPGMALYHLNLGHTGVRDVSPLAKLPLTVLSVPHTPVASTRVLGDGSWGTSPTFVTDGSRVGEIENLETVHTFVGPPTKDAGLPTARYSCESRNRPAECVLEDLAKELNLEISFDRKEFVRAGVEMGEPIVLEAQNVSREVLLDAFAEAAGVRYEITGRVLKIFPANRAGSGDTPKNK